MVKIIFKYILIGLISFFSGCGIDNSSGTDNVSNTLSVSLSGRVADGYISGATVCIDIDTSGECGTNEPTTTTDDNGYFDFGTMSVESGRIVSFISIGGTDTATAKTFEGKLRSIKQINAQESIYITPLTDLIAKSFLSTTTKTATDLQNATLKISNTYEIHQDYVDQSPMVYAGIFARTQEIQQVKGMLSTIVKKAKATVLTTSQKLVLDEQIKSAILSGISDGDIFSLSNAFVNLEESTELTLPENEKTFANEQMAHIKVDIESFVSDTNLTQENLNDYQVALEQKADNAYTIINETDENSTLSSFALNIDIFAVDVDDNNTVPPDTNTSDSTDLNVSFSGIVVDGYIKDATVCMDLDYSGDCNTSEPTTTTDANGKFNFTNVIVQENTLFPIISSGGVDTFSAQAYDAQLKTIVLANELASSTYYISPLTDIVATHFLEQSVQNKTVWLESISTIETQLGLTSAQIFGDTTSFVSTFMISQYIEHIKRMLELTVISYDNSKDVDALRERIKKAIVSELDQNYDNLQIDSILELVDIGLGLNISQEYENFYTNTLVDIKNVLDNLQSSDEVFTYTLPVVQRILEDSLALSYSEVTYHALDINVSDVVDSSFEKDSATYDQMACDPTYYPNVFSDDNSTYGWTSDATDDGLTIESFTNEVKVYYKNLDISLTTVPVTINDDEGLFTFSFDKAWVDKSERVYIQTPKDENNISKCYRVVLDSTSKENIELEKVFKYSY
ncbi:MAG: hypothetical protein OQJ77_06355 [Thiovulaceae bacterium]|nr:hypothetical protein [Sulfurimonadaceae bacterium]